MIDDLEKAAGKGVEEKEKVYNEVKEKLEKTGHLVFSNKRLPVNSEDGDYFAVTTPDKITGPGQPDVWEPGATMEQKITFFERNIKGELHREGIGYGNPEVERRGAELDLRIGVLIHELVHMNQRSRGRERDEIDAYKKEKSYYKGAKCGEIYRKRAEGGGYKYKYYRKFLNDQIKRTMANINKFKEILKERGK